MRNLTNSHISGNGEWSRDRNPAQVTVAARPQLLIFDLDGTLTDSAQGIVSSFRHALGEICGGGARR